MAKLKMCVLGCGGLVSGGGDRHGVGLCNMRSQSSRRRRRAHQRGPQVGDSMIHQRGAVVAGTGVPKGEK